MVPICSREEEEGEGEKRGGGGGGAREIEIERCSCFGHLPGRRICSYLPPGCPLGLLPTDLLN